MTVPQFAKHCGVSPKTVRNWMAQGRIKYRVSKSETGRKAYWILSKDRPERKPEGNHSKKVQE